MSEGEKANIDFQYVTDTKGEMTREQVKAELIVESKLDA